MFFALRRKHWLAMQAGEDERKSPCYGREPGS